ARLVRCVVLLQHHTFAVVSENLASEFDLLLRGLHGGKKLDVWTAIEDAIVEGVQGLSALGVRTLIRDLVHGERHIEKPIGSIRHEFAVESPVSCEGLKRVCDCIVETDDLASTVDAHEILPANLND